MSNGYKVQWTDTAKADLYSIIEYIDNDNSGGAINVLEKIQLAGGKLEQNPGHGRYVPELRELDIYIYRELMIKPWRLIYRYDKQNVYILSVLDGRRHLESLLIERLVR